MTGDGEKKECTFDRCPYHRDHVSRIKHLEDGDNRQWQEIGGKTSLKIFMWVIGIILAIGFTWANIQDGTQKKLLADVAEIKKDIAVIRTITTKLEENSK